MRAITCTGYGRPTDVLRPAEIDPPAVGDRDVLVRVHAASLNPADWHVVRGEPYIARLSVGLRRPSFEVAGSDFAGVVESVGPEVTSVRPGDEVFGTTFMAGFGAFAEQVAVPERLVARVPAGTSFAEAAAVPLAGLTALQALRDHGGVQPGHRVLIIGASGGVGSLAVQLATGLGAAVTGVASTRNLDLVRSLGADHVVDHTAGDVTDTDERYDLVLQLAGTAPASRLRHLLVPTGTLLMLSGDSPDRWFGPVGRVVAGRLQAPFVRRTITTFDVRPNGDDLAVLAQLLAPPAPTGRFEPMGTDRTEPSHECPSVPRTGTDGQWQDGSVLRVPIGRDGTLRPVLDRIDALDDVPASLERLEAGGTRGKVVIDVAGGAGHTDRPVASGMHVHE